jgi:hypothetical protein
VNHGECDACYPTDQVAEDYANDAVDKAWRDGDVSFFQTQIVGQLIYDAYIAGREAASP